MNNNTNKIDILHYMCHGCARGSRNEETRIETNRVFNVEQTEEAQEHR